MQENKLHTALSTLDVSIGYASKNSVQEIVSSISINSKQGALVGLIGINGSGKSTLLRTLAGIQKPLKGEIQIAGQTIQCLSAQEMAQKVSVVLTNQPISKNLTVLELVSLGRQPYANWLGNSNTEEDTKLIHDALVATDTYAYQEKRCYALSDGQLQRVLIARALVQDTDIILLDEPFSHLDLHHKAAILKLLKTIAHSQGKTIIFSTHDIEHVLPLCDSLFLLKEGVCIQGSPQELIKEGVFNSLFPSKHITFDPSTGRFFID